MHNPARYGFAPTDSGARDNQLYRLTEKKFIFGFNKNTAAADIFNQTTVSLITTVEKHGFQTGLAWIFPWIRMGFYTAAPGGRPLQIGLAV